MSTRIKTHLPTKEEITNMKLSIALLSAVAMAEEKKVPPRHPLQRLQRLVQFSDELLNDWYGFLPSQDKWIQKFNINADRMSRAFTRGEQKCGFYDEQQGPHGGPDNRERRDAGEERYNRNDPVLGTRQVCQGFSKWAMRYIASCSGQKTHNYQSRRMNNWNDKLQMHLTRQNEGSGSEVTM